MSAGGAPTAQVIASAAPAVCGCVRSNGQT